MERPIQTGRDLRAMSLSSTAMTKKKNKITNENSIDSMLVGFPETARGYTKAQQ